MQSENILKLLPPGGTDGKSAMHSITNRLKSILRFQYLKVQEYLRLDVARETCWQR